MTVVFRVETEPVMTLTADLLLRSSVAVPTTGEASPLTVSLTPETRPFLRRPEVTDPTTLVTVSTTGSTGAVSPETTSWRFKLDATFSTDSTTGAAAGASTPTERRGAARTLALKAAIERVMSFIMNVDNECGSNV